MFFYGFGSDGRPPHTTKLRVLFLEYSSLFYGG